MHQATRAVFPAYRCEFSGAETEDEAAFRYVRAAGVQATRWGREPNPYLRMRMRTGSGREIRKRGFANPRTLLVQFEELSGREGGFVEFENYRRRVWTVTWQETYVVTEEAGEPRRLDFDELVEFAKDMFYGPNRAAGEPAFVKPY